MRRRRLGVWLVGMLCLSLLAAGCSAGGGGASKPSYPTKQIELAAGTAPGGASDLVGRTVGDFLSKKWGQPVVVSPKPGGSGAIAAQYVLQGKADGYTMLVDNMTTSSMMVAGMKNPPVKLEDRVFVARVATCPVGYAVKADAPWKTLGEFAEWVKANPDKLTWATSGATGLPSFGVYQFLDTIGVDPSKTGMVVTGGGSESVVQLAGGHVVLACQSVQEEYSLASSGEIRILAITGDERLPFLPDVPTCKEAGFPQLTMQWWAGIAGPKDLPKDVVKAWDDALSEAAKDTEFKAALDKLHYLPGFMGSEEFTKFVYDECAVCTQIAEKTGIRK